LVASRISGRSLVSWGRVVVSREKVTSFSCLILYGWFFLSVFPLFHLQTGFLRFMGGCGVGPVGGRQWREGARWCLILMGGEGGGLHSTRISRRRRVEGGQRGVVSGLAHESFGGGGSRARRGARWVADIDLCGRVEVGGGLVTWALPFG
jgi:hypothetical protein